MEIISSIKFNFLFFLIMLSIKPLFLQIHDNFVSGILEEGNYDLLDVTDYYNSNLIVSSSKVIYTGIPPVKKKETNANLIKYSSLITINENYLLAACLQDSFLGKINLSTGNFISLLSYSDLIESETLEAPKAICSISSIDNLIFISNSKITEANGEKNVIINIFKISINNKESIDEGPLINNITEIKYFQLKEAPKNNQLTGQISCQPLSILDNQDDYRLICLYESIYSYVLNEKQTFEYSIYALIINSNFDGFENGLDSNLINRDSNYLGFRIYRENDTYIRCLSGHSLIEIYLANNSTIKSNFILSFYNLKADLDLISYNNEFTFSAQKISFMGKNDIYSLQINQKNYKNYFRYIDYSLNNIEKI